MTKFVSVIEKKEVKKTVFTHWYSNVGTKETETLPSELDKVIYLGKDCGKDTFAGYDCDGSITIYLGVKGDEEFEYIK